MSTPTSSTTPPHPPTTLLKTYLSTIEHDIIPLTRKGIAAGSKVFGAAILKKSDLSVVMVATNDEAKCPLWHGETNCIRKFYEKIPRETRPNAKDCLFLTTHEPCSLCISAITWGGFDNFTYLYTYASTRDTFSIPHDLNILHQVYRVPSVCPQETPSELESRELYNRHNRFFDAGSIEELLDMVEEGERKGYEEWIARIKGVYEGLAGEYGRGKGGVGIPLD